MQSHTSILRLQHAVRLPACPNIWRSSTQAGGRQTKLGTAKYTAASKITAPHDDVFKSLEIVLFDHYLAARMQNIIVPEVASCLLAYQDEVDNTKIVFT